MISKRIQSIFSITVLVAFAALLFKEVEDRGVEHLWYLTKSLLFVLVFGFVAVAIILALFWSYLKMKNKI